MKAKIFALAALACLCLSAYASEPAKREKKPFDKSFSLELGYGIQPLHMTFAPTSEEKRALADQGFSESGDSFCPALSLAAMWRTGYHWELGAIAGISWCHFQTIEYSTFGFDPNGKARYNLREHHDGGWKDSDPIMALCFQARFIWNPQWKVCAYSAAQIGLTSASFIIPIPGITPVALRYGGKHFYGFLEATLSPIATFGHGGIGWKF